jgi:hypothetical protein
MVVCQLGPVVKDVKATESEKVVTNPRIQTDTGVEKEFIQAPSPRSPFKLLFKTEEMGTSASTQDSDLTDQETREEEERGRD